MAMLDRTTARGRLGNASGSGDARLGVGEVTLKGEIAVVIRPKLVI